MPTKVLITGGSGLVGTYLTDLLLANDFEVCHLSRKPTGAEKVPTFQWNIDTGALDVKALQVDHIIHLAGAGVADSKWTEKRKQAIYNSRIDSTRLLAQALTKHGLKLESFVCASAVGYYGSDTGAVLVDEDAPPANDFLAKVVVDWEAAAEELRAVSKEVTKIRIGVVLAKEGGALAKMKQPIQFGVGAPLGSGKQYVSWIHVRDLCAICLWALQNGKGGVYNAVAPNPVTNKELTRHIARTLKRPLLLPPVPGMVLKGLLGEMAGIVLGGNNVSSRKLVDSGFKFEFDTVEHALRDLLT